MRAIGALASPARRAARAAGREAGRKAGREDRGKNFLSDHADSLVTLELSGDGDPRICRHLEQVDRCVDYDVTDTEEQRDTRDGREIPARNALLDVQSDARPRKDGLDDDVA